MEAEGVVNDTSPTTVAVDTEEEGSTEDTNISLDNATISKNDVVVNDTDILLPAPDMNDTDPLLDIEPINNVTSAPTISPSVSSTEDTSTSSPSVHQTTLQPITISTTTVPSLAPSILSPTTPYPTTKDYYYYNNFFTDRHNLILGCSPKNYFIDPNNLLGTSHSLYKLYFDEILPKTFIPIAKEHDYHSTPLVMQHVDTDMFLTENTALYPGVVTTNDMYNMISIEEMFVPLAHGVHGDQILKLIDEFAIGNDTDTVAVSSTINNRQKYTLYTISKDEDLLGESMEQLNITITASLPSTSKEYMVDDVSLQSVWVDFIMKQWKYDDNGCLGHKEDSSGGKHNHDDGKHTHDKPSTTTHDHDKGGSANISGGEANVAANSPSRGSVTPQSNNSNTQPIAAGLSVVLLVAIAVVGTLAFFIIRKSQSPNRQSWETSISRQSELGNSNNDLELQANDAYEDEERSVDYTPPMSSFA